MTHPLRRLRLAFVALGIALTLTVAGLLQSALSRLEEQRLYRHTVVADRVFDEAEREISALLQHEATRASAAYDAQDTDPERWGRFVVGYYTREPELRIVAEQRLDERRATAVRDAVSRAIPSLMQGGRPSQWPQAPTADEDPVPNRSPDVLRQLNRGVKVRERRQHDVTRIFAVAEADPLMLVLERTTPQRHEGFVLSVEELMSTIQSWVLSAQRLDAVGKLQVATVDRDDNNTSNDSIDTPTRSADGYVFVHRLAAPLDGQHVALHLSRLDDEDAAGTLYSLALLLVGAAVLGLYAIYRMVAVRVTFAERRNNFVAAVTHELRTPLTSIRMYGELLRDDMVQDEATRHEYYAAITSEGERLTRLINNVMEHGQLRRGQRHTHLERVDVHGVVREVVELMSPHATQEGFTLCLDATDAPPMAQIDVDALKQVLFNVIDNALKYGRGTRAEVRVTCTRGAQDTVVIRVRDYGPGIDPTLQSAIFQPFYRGENELTRRHKGTGLGLALAHDLLALVRGTIAAKSQTPGLEVTITLPAAPTEMKPTQ